MTTTDSVFQRALSNSRILFCNLSHPRLEITRTLTSKST
jgi:hypothetical protein